MSTPSSSPWSRRLAAALASIGLIALASCGSDEPAASAPSTTAVTAASSTTTADGPATTAVPATRVVTDATGTEVTVPGAPKRIVAVGEVEADTLLALKITPVAIITGRGQTGPQNYLAKELAGLPIVGTAAALEYDKIAALKPDLILAYVDAAMLTELRKITPATVSTYLDPYDWRENSKLVADAVNRKADGEALIDAFNAKVAAAKTQLGAKATSKISIIRWSKDGPQLLAARAGGPEIAKQLGLTFPSAQPTNADGGAHSDPLSLENLSKLDSEHIFVGTLSPTGDAKSALDTALKAPAWAQLDAVKKGEVSVVDGALFTSLVGPLGATMVLDQLVAAIK